MALASAQVVDALAALIASQAGLVAISTTRGHPWDEASLPACRVTAEQESVEAASLGGDINKHLLTVSAQYTTRAVSNLDDAMHALAAAGLALLFAGTPPYGLQLTSIERELSTEGEAAVGVITLTLQTMFFVAPSAPETIL